MGALVDFTSLGWLKSLFQLIGGTHLKNICLLKAIIFVRFHCLPVLRGEDSLKISYHSYVMGIKTLFSLMYKDQTLLMLRDFRGSSKYVVIRNLWCSIPRERERERLSLEEPPQLSAVTKREREKERESVGNSWGLSTAISVTPQPLHNGKKVGYKSLIFLSLKLSLSVLRARWHCLCY